MLEFRDAGVDTVPAERILDVDRDGGCDGIRIIERSGPAESALVACPVPVAFWGGGG